MIYDSLKFMDLIERTILAQTEYQHPFSTIYEQEVEFYSFHQQILTNDQCYDKFNTKVDTRFSIGVTRQHKYLIKYVAQESNIKYDDMSIEEQENVKEYDKENYLSYVFLRQSGKQNNKLKTDPQNNFTTGNGRMPNKRQMNLHLLDKNTNNPVVSQPI